jgi:phosphonate transport system permease protein
VTATAQVMARPPQPSHAKRNVALAATALLIGWAVVTLDYDPARILELPGGIGQIFYLMYLKSGPDWSYLGSAFGYMVESLEMAWIGTVIGALISLPLGFFGAKNVSSGLVSNVMRQVLNGIRAFPELVLAVVIFIPIAGLGPVAGALAMGLHSVGTLGKLTAEVVEGIDPGPVEAARATGARSLQVQRWGVLPQVMPEIVAFWLYRFEINIRASAVLGVVGAGGIGFALSQTIAFHRYALTGTALLVVVVVTIAVDTTSGYLRRRIIQGSEAKVTGEIVASDLAELEPHTRAHMEDQGS